jgi:RNA:NAD 2'-phosphotransferase (TPT1/KptA family)
MIKLKSLIIESLEIPIYLYHATYDVFIDSIRQHGLVPGGKEFRNYELSDNNYVYLTSNEHAALSFIDNIDKDVPDEYLNNYSVITIDTRKINKRLLFPDKNWNPGDDLNSSWKIFMYKGIIPPKAIRF